MYASVSFDPGYAILALQDLRLAIKDGLAKAVAFAADAAEKSAKNTSLYQNKTGKLRDRTFKRRIDPTSAEVIANTKYAQYVNNGHLPHFIFARRKQFLRFVQNGEVKFRRYVRHPGAAPRPFMDVAEMVGGQVLSTLADQYTDEAIRRHNGG